MDGESERLITTHGGYRRLKTFQLAEVIYDVTALFCDKFIDRRSRTHDQMVQAARSGRQNLAEGSMDSATSKKIELKLTGIARGSLEELRLDYEDYLRQRNLPQWPPGHPALVRFKELRCDSLPEFRKWVAGEVRRAKAQRTDTHGPAATNSGTDVSSPQHKSVGVRGPNDRVSLEALPAVLAANGALSLLNLCIHLTGRQLKAQAKTFEEEGGFTERMYRVRSANRRKGK